MHRAVRHRRYFQYGLVLLIGVGIVAVLLPFISSIINTLYGSVILQALSWQRAFNRQLMWLFSQYSAHHHFSIAFSLISLSFIYGVVHAVGPGHGKAVIASYLATQRSQVVRGICLSMLGALMQAITAIVVVTVLMLVFGWFATRVMGSVRYLEAFSFSLVILLGALIIVRALVKLRRMTQITPAQTNPIHQSLASATFSTATPNAPSMAARDTHLAPNTPSNLLDMRFAPINPSATANSYLAAPAQGASHIHPDGFSCHCAHHIDPADVSGGFKESALAVLAIGARPCTGALLVLGAASLLGQWLIGTIAVVCMGIGSGITVSVVGVLCVFARKLILRVAQRKRDTRRGCGQFAVAGVSLLGGIVICLLGITLLSHVSLTTSSGFSLGS